MDTVLILLAAYNGQKYVGEMIDSIISQDYNDWHLILSDDSSSDSTFSVLEEYANKFPEKITHYKSGQKFGNAQNHFMHLLEQYNDAPYIMFCDQDDVWHSDKISKTFNKMKEIEKKTDVPAMVHTDLRVVDGDLNILDSSFMHFSKLDGSRLSLNNLLAQNVVTGCTMMINKALAKQAVQSVAKGEILMHDWWLALIASAYGQTGFLEDATIDYRQHNDNVVGAKNIRSVSYLLKKFLNKETKTLIKQTFTQAKSIYECLDGSIGEKENEILKQYAMLEKDNWFKRQYKYIKYDFYKNGIVRKIGQIIWG